MILSCNEICASSLRCVAARVSSSKQALLLGWVVLVQGECLAQEAGEHGGFDLFVRPRAPFTAGASANARADQPLVCRREDRAGPAVAVTRNKA